MSWPYSTTAWQKLRAAHLAQEPLCRMCRELGILTPADVVDHITPWKQDPGRVFDPSNLASLCKPCHDGHKQSAEKTGVERGCTPDGTPRRGWD